MSGDNYKTTLLSVKNIIGDFTSWKIPVKVTTTANIYLY